MVVYTIVNSETLKIYIGQHNREDDLGKYFSKKFYDAQRKSGKRSHIYAAMRKYSRDKWSIHPLISGIADKKELDETEQLLIYALNAQHPDVGYNICDGGEGFTGPQSPEAKAKISAALTGRPVSAETRAKIGASQPRSAAQLAAIDRTGKPHTPETIAKMMGNQNCLGRVNSEETLVKMRESAKMRGISPETKKKMQDARFLKTVAWG
jgi:hypothetical protein